MKGLVSAATLAIMYSASAVAGTHSPAPGVADQAQLELHLTGEVRARCRITTTQDTTLNLNLNQDQNKRTATAKEFTFKAWCNGHIQNSTLQVTADALKMDGEGSNEYVIPMEISVNNQTGRVDTARNAKTGYDFPTNIEVSNSTTGDMGKNHVLAIKPTLNGFERAGTYQSTVYLTLNPR